MDVLLGIDIGTSGTKSVLIDTKGQILSIAHRTYTFDTPHAGWAEQDPEIWWQATAGTIREALDGVGIAPSKIRGVGFSGQMHGLVPLDEDRRPIRPAILWADQRSASQVRWIYDRVGRERLARLTGNPVATGFMAASLLWMRENEFDQFRQIRTVMLPKDYIRMRLTGEIGTDSTDASSSLLFDTAGRQWSVELLDLLDLDRGMLPDVGESQALAGKVTEDAARSTGLSQGTPVVLGGGDQPMQAVGNGLVSPGVASSTIGTGGQFFTPAERPAYDPELRTHTFCHAVPGMWNIMGASLCAGMALRWFRENVADGISFEELSDAASSVSPGSEGLIFLPYLVGERTPHMDPNARGMFFGLTLQHTRAHMVRAIMEGVTFALRDSMEIFRGLGLRMDRILASGGGARSPVWRQIQADVFGRKLYTTSVQEQASLGAALVAGAGVGIYTSVVEACRKAVRTDDTPTDPDPKRAERYDRMYEIFQELYRNNRDSFHNLSVMM